MVVPYSVLYVQHPKKTKRHAIQKFNVIRLQIKSQNNADNVANLTAEFRPFDLEEIQKSISIEHIHGFLDKRTGTCYNQGNQVP